MLDNYYRTCPGPLGSTDRKCAVDTKSLSLFTALNGGNPELASIWAEKSITSWVQSLSTTCSQYIPDVEGFGNFFIFSSPWYDSLLLFEHQWGCNDNTIVTHPSASYIYLPTLPVLSRRCIDRLPRTRVAGDSCAAYKTARSNASRHMRPFVETVDNLFLDYQGNKYGLAANLGNDYHICLNWSTPWN